GTLFFVYQKLEAVGGEKEGEEVKGSIVEEGEKKGGEKESKKGKETKAIPKPLLRLDTFIVNLADQDSSRYLRITLELELMDEVTLQEIEKRMAPVRDAVLSILPTKKVQDIVTAEGKQVLKNQLMEAINKNLAKGKVTNIFYTEFVIQ
ncbi:MAG: flagellar basal body-associated protein FliL, partial [Desulfatiglandales bacterium]